MRQDYVPHIIKKQKVTEVTDLNNKKYLDFTMVGTGTSVNWLC